MKIKKKSEEMPQYGKSYQNNWKKQESRGTNQVRQDRNMQQTGITINKTTHKKFAIAGEKNEERLRKIQGMPWGQSQPFLLYV